MADNPKWPLTNQEKTNYLQWLLRSGARESGDYNMPQFYRSAEIGGDPRLSSSINPNDQQVHFPDAFKFPNHRTFSTDSNYFNPQTMPNTPTWQGGLLADGNNESWTLARPNGEVVEQENPFMNEIARLLRSR